MMNQSASATRRPPTGSFALPGCCPVFLDPFVSQAAPPPPPPLAPNHLAVAAAAAAAAQQCALGPQPPAQPPQQPQQQPPPSSSSTNAPQLGQTNSNGGPNTGMPASIGGQQHPVPPPPPSQAPIRPVDHHSNYNYSILAHSLQGCLQFLLGVPPARSPAADCMVVAAALASASFRSQHQQLQQAHQQPHHQQQPQQPQPPLTQQQAHPASLPSTTANVAAPPQHQSSQRPQLQQPQNQHQPQTTNVSTAPLYPFSSAADQQPPQQPQQQQAPPTQQQQQPPPQQQPQLIPPPLPFYSSTYAGEQALALFANPHMASTIFSQAFNMYLQNVQSDAHHTHQHHHPSHHFQHHLHGPHHHHHHHHHHGPNGQNNGQDDTMLTISESKPRGLNRAEIDSLTAYIQTNEKDPRTCVICLSRFELKSKIRPLPCNHAFHAKCVDKWLRANRTCPICRRDALKTYGTKIKRI